jgi:hypothetical protein
METDMFSYDNCGLMFGKLHDLQKHTKKWCSENQRKSTFERKLSTENEDRDQTGSGLEAKAPRWFTDNIQSDRGVKRSMSEESDDYTYIPPKMDLLSQEQRVKSPWTKLLRKQLALDWEKNIEERRHEFEKEGDEYTVANARAVNHFLPQLRKDLRKRIVELMVNLDKLSVDPLCKEIERTVEQYKYTYDMPKDEAIKQAVKTRKEIIDHNLQPPLDEDPENDYEYENVEDDN